MIEFKTWLKQERERKGLSVAELAELTKYSTQQIYNLERGSRYFALPHFEIFTELFQTTVQLVIKEGKTFLVNESPEPLPSFPISEKTEATLMLDKLQENLLENIEYLIEGMSDNKMHQQWEARLNQLIAIAKQQDFPTGSLERTKEGLVGDYLDKNRVFQHFIVQRELYLSQCQVISNSLNPTQRRWYYLLDTLYLSKDSENLDGIRRPLEWLKKELIAAL